MKARSRDHFFHKRSMKPTLIRATPRPSWTAYPGRLSGPSKDSRTPKPVGRYVWTTYNPWRGSKYPGRPRPTWIDWSELTACPRTQNRGSRAQYVHLVAFHGSARS